MSIKNRILEELKQGYALSDEDLAVRLSERPASVRRTRLEMYRARLIEFAGLSSGQETWTLKRAWS